MKVLLHDRVLITRANAETRDDDVNVNNPPTSSLSPFLLANSAKVQYIVYFVYQLNKLLFLTGKECCLP